MKGQWQDPRRLSRKDLDSNYRTMAEAIERKSSPPNTYQVHLVGLYLAELSRRDSVSYDRTILWTSIVGVVVSAVGVCATVLAVFLR